MKAATAEPGATSSVAANAAALATSKVVTSSLLFGWQIVLGRALGSASYGVYGTIGALMAVGAAIADLGTGTIVVRDVARRPDLAGRYFTSSLALQSVLALLAYAVLQAGAAALGYDADLRALLVFVGVNLLIDAAGTAGHNQLVAAERMWRTGLISVAHVVVLVALGSLALAFGGGLWAIYAALVGASLIRAVLYLAAARRATATPGMVPGIDPGLARRVLAAGLPLGAAALVSLAFLHADKLVTTVILGVEATGQLTAAFVLVFGVAELLGSTLLVATLPVMSRGAAHDRPAANPSMLESLIYAVLLIGVPAAALIAWLGSGIVQLLFGAGYAAAGAVLRVLGWCVVVRMLEGAIAQALLVRDRQRNVLVARLGGLCVNLVLTISLLPRIGVMGAAVGTLAGELAMTACMLVALAPPAEWRLRMGRRAVRLAGPILVLGASVAVADSRLPVLATAVVGIVAYTAAAAATGAISRHHLLLFLRAVPGGSRFRPS